MNAINAFIDMICNGLLTAFKYEQIVVILISILPIVEARGAIPIAIGYGLPPLEGWFYAFLGSSLITPILLLVLIPFINWLSRTRIFKKIGTVLYEKFESKTAGIGGANAEIKDTINAENLSEEERLKAKKAEQKRENKKMLGVLIFVAIPLPLTGVWTGSAIAAITKLKFSKSLIALITGNLIASLIMTLLSVIFKKYVNMITLIIGIIAILIVVVLIVKIIIPKKAKKNE